MNIIIDGKVCKAESGEFLLPIARRNGIDIPTLCHSDALSGQASCRLCIVDVAEKGWHRIVTSCVYPVTGEIEVMTSSDKIIEMRRTIIMLLSARAPQSEYINSLKRQYSVQDTGRFSGDPAEKCVLCGLCVKACEQLGPCAISTVNRGITKKVSTPYDEPSGVCVGCGSCARACPTGAIEMLEDSTSRTIWKRKHDLLGCRICGKPFITWMEMKYLSRRLGIKKYDLVCKKCRKALLSRKMRDVSESFSL
ncbi:MAG: 2Fe-2S iron-sulfur cluster-binding protein [Vulcanimicrobiota bacterium]